MRKWIVYNYDIMLLEQKYHKLNFPLYKWAVGSEIVCGSLFGELAPNP